jgi:A/G-specific adenine glycosylase
MNLHHRKISAIVKGLSAWFSQSARDLAWRRTRDPYAIWVSEIIKYKTLNVKTIGKVKSKFCTLILWVFGHNNLLLRV